MDHVDLSITIGYVPGWGFWEGAREIIQNALDRERDTDDGKDPVKRVMSEFAASITYNQAEETLVVENQGTTMERGTLLLGAGTKSENGDTIGQHGEGYKLAMLALTRAGHRVTLYNGIEVWRPEIARNTELGADVLRVSFEPGDYMASSLRFEIEDVSPAQWEIVQGNVRRLHEAGDVLRGETGWLLASPQEMGRLYVGGLFVRQLNERFLYGYDFDPNVLHLDRDRSAVDSFDLSWECGRLLRDLGVGNFQERLLMDAMSKTSQDVQYLLRSATPLVNKVKETAFEEFIGQFGESAFPVDDEHQARWVRKTYVGVNPVVVNDVLCGAITESEGWARHVSGLDQIDVKTPADILREFADSHRQYFSSVLLDAFAAELIDRAEAESWRL